MNNKLIISVDSGKHSTKFTYFNKLQQLKKGFFPSTFKEVMQKDEFSVGFFIELFGKKYQVGEKVDHVTYGSNSKLTDETELFVYSAIGRAIEQSKYPTGSIIDVYLAINVPLNEYRVSESRKKYVTKYLANTCTVACNNMKYVVNIKTVNPYFESQGVILRYIEKYRVMERVYVIDIGGKNDTHSFFEYGKINGAHTDMFNNGILNMLTKLQMDMNRNPENEYSINDIEYMIKNKKFYGNFEELYRIHATDLLKEILLSTHKTKINLQLTHVVFTGGGALLLEPFIEEVFKDVMYELQDSCVEDNSVGGFQLARYGYNSKHEKQI